MKWIKYQIVCNEQEGVLIEKRIAYSDENLAFARQEALNSSYTIVEDEESYEKEPLSIESGGTGAKTPEEARANLGILLSIEIEEIFKQYNQSSQSCKRDDDGNVIYKDTESYVFCENQKLTQLHRNNDITVTDTFETSYVLTLDGVQPTMEVKVRYDERSDYANPDYNTGRTCVGYLYDAANDTLLSQVNFEISAGSASSSVGINLCTFTLTDEAQLYVCKNSPTLKFVLESTKMTQGDTLSYFQLYGLRFEVKKAERFAFNFQEVSNA